MKNDNKGSVLITVAAGILILITLGYGLWKYTKKETAQVDIKTEVTPLNVSETSFKDGSYTRRGNYFSPGGEEQIDVTVVIKNDTVTESSVGILATRPISKKLQGVFEANYRPLVIGKKIDDVVLDKVSGSSLTPKGWNDAIAKIMVEAQK